MVTSLTTHMCKSLTFQPRPQGLAHHPAAIPAAAARPLSCRPLARLASRASRQAPRKIDGLPHAATPAKVLEAAFRCKVEELVPVLDRLLQLYGDGEPLAECQAAFKKLIDRADKRLEKLDAETCHRFAAAADTLGVKLTAGQRERLQQRAASQGGKPKPRRIDWLPAAVDWRDVLYAAAWCKAQELILVLDKLLQLYRGHQQWAPAQALAAIRAALEKLFLRATQRLGKLDGDTCYRFLATAAAMGVPLSPAMRQRWERQAKSQAPASPCGVRLRRSDGLLAAGTCAQLLHAAAWCTVKDLLPALERLMQLYGGGKPLAACRAALRTLLSRADKRLGKLDGDTCRMFLDLADELGVELPAAQRVRWEEQMEAGWWYTS